MAKKEGWIKIGLYFVFIVYGVIMFRLLFIRASTWLSYKYNLIPFKSYFYTFNYADVKFWVFNFFGNLALFIPFGLMLPIVITKFQGFKRYFLLLLSIIVVVEVLQLVTRVGSFDVDDIILNSIGGLIGFIISKKLLASKVKKLV